MNKEKTLLRLDRFLSDLGYGTRKELKEYIKKSRVTVDGVVVRRPETKVSITDNVVCLDDEVIEYKKDVYLLMNKPAGVISATVDPKGVETPVTDLLPEEYFYLGLSPVGRLDKDAVGLLLLTNDGKYNHMMTSPKKNIFKTYYVIGNGKFKENWKAKVESGLLIDEDFRCKPAELYTLNEYIEETGKNYLEEQCREFVDQEILDKLESHTYFEAIIRITEGKFHQVKRMFIALESEVMYLKRIGFGLFDLPVELKEGEVMEVIIDNEIK